MIRSGSSSAAAEVGAVSTSAFDVTDPAALQRFLAGLPEETGHVMVTAGGQYYAPLAEMDFEAARRALDEHLLLPLRIGRYAAGKVRPGGTLIFMTGTGARRPGPGLAIAAIAAAAVPPSPPTWPRAGPGPGQPHRGRVRRYAPFRPVAGR